MLTGCAVWKVIVVVVVEMEVEMEMEVTAVGRQEKRDRVFWIVPALRHRGGADASPSASA